MKTIKIVGAGSCLPGKKIFNDKLAQIYSVPEEWLDMYIGNKSRHYCIDLETGEIQNKLADISKVAAEKALENARIPKTKIDFVVMTTAVPDYLMPATVNITIDQLGMNAIPTYELRSGCAGAIQALDTAFAFLQSGKYKTGLVIGGDAGYKGFDLKRDYTKLKTQELINFILFSDGAGAVVVTSDHSVAGIDCMDIINRCEGQDKEPGQLVNWSFPGILLEGKQETMKENYKAIEKNVPIMAKEMMNELLEKQGWDIKDVAYFMPPQLGGNITKNIIDFMGIPFERSINTVIDNGNCGNANLFFQLEKLLQTMKIGDKSIGISIESSKWIKGGISLCKTQ